METPTTAPSVVEAKTVIRCRDFQASYDFYQRVLGFAVLEEWHEPGEVGCIFAPVANDPAAAIEIYEMGEDDPRYETAFSQPFATDKIDIQLRTLDLQSWTDRLRDRWSFSAPTDTPWGHRWIKLRDPDNLLIAIYEVIG